MSITLVAYPAGFLISPSSAKKERIKQISADSDKENKQELKSLISIKVLTNMDYSEFMGIIKLIGSDYNFSNGILSFSNGLNVKPVIENRKCSLVFTNRNNNEIQAQAEDLFQQLDRFANKNVRVIKGHEYFYNYYNTNYSDSSEILSELKKQGAKNIYKTPDSEITADINGQSIKYYKPESSINYILETETRINIVNIGLDEYENADIYRNAFKSWKIQTSIKPEELTLLLQKSGYSIYRGNLQTPLRSVNATLNWYLQDGTYVAEFSGPDYKILKNEAEQLFRKMNIAAGRDLRNIEQKSKIIYSYNTNYTDKGVLINTLLEHGASDLIESGENISCKLFGMDMNYFKKDGVGAYILEITKVSDIKECQDVVDDLNDEYGLNIQEITYNKIKERLNDENMHLENETVLEDNSIVLTIDVG